MRLLAVFASYGPSNFARVSSLAAFVSLSACNVFDESLETRVEGQSRATAAQCSTHADCSLSAEMALACVLPEGRCVPLKSEDCTGITGSLIKPGVPDAIVIGSLFSVTGAQTSTNLVRQQSAILAVEEINRAGGIPSASGAGMGRPLVLVSCDEAASLRRAGAHLIDELKVPAIVGPNTSQDTLDLSTELSIKGGTVLVSPTGVASSIADLDDNDLTWTMVPSDVQRAPLMRQQIGELETQLREQRTKQVVKLSVIYRADALGVGTRDSLTSLVINGKPLADPSNLNVNVKVEPYSIDGSDSERIVAAQAAFAPDIVVLAGTAEVIALIVEPLEERWSGQHRPYYVAIDSVKVPEVLDLAARREDLRGRVRGTGIVPTARSQPVYDAFRVDYEARFPGSPSTISGMGPAYDATFAIAFAMAATRDRPVSGMAVAAGLRKFSAGGGSEIEVQGTNVLAAMTQLTSGKAIQAIGTFGPLQWDDQGAPLGGSVEIWCIARGGMQPYFRSSGLTLDLKTQRLSGSYEQCEL